MNAKILSGIAIVIIALAGGYIYFQQKTEEASGLIKSPHFLDSTPLHGEVYAAQPINITINFDFDLAQGSDISVTSSEGQEWTSGEVRIEDNNTALKKDLKQGMPDGSYSVKYTACWPDGSCHDGSFAFIIDSAKVSGYQDMRGREEITIKAENIMFEPKMVIVSPGTKVTWENIEDIGHFVNTETHPEHTYFPMQNSSQLNQGDTFSTTFETPGQYNYHCSAHVPQGMLGSILVLE